MTRWIGHNLSSGIISIVSSATFSAPGNSLVVTELPDNYDHVSSNDLIANFRATARGLRNRKPHAPANELRVAFVGNWKMRCGISTYAEQLWPHVAKHLGDFKLFVEFNDHPTGSIFMFDGNELPSHQVVPCWSRGQSLRKLELELEAYDPDIVWIQHEFGLWPDAAKWLPFISRLSNWCRPIVTMHSVFHHRDKTIVEAAIPEIVVHLEGAAQVLKQEKGVPGNVTVIPHGCTPVDPNARQKLWNFYKSDHTFMQFGFGFRYKGWELAIQTTYELKKKYPDVFFTGLFSESPFCATEHQLYYDQLMKLINDADLHENVAIIRGYQSDASLDSYLRTNNAVIFPYVSHPEHEVFGASGAARYAMSKAVPVITTSVNHFSDVPTIKASSPSELAAKLDQIFSDEKFKNQQIENQLQYVEDNSWEKVAKRYIWLFETGA